MPSQVTVVERFWNRVDKDGPVPAHRPDLGQCWVWTGAHNGNGYGTFTDGCTHLAHRWLYVFTRGPLPKDTPLLDHLCRNIGCVNPAHLEPVTHRENILRGGPVKRFAVKQRKARELEATGMRRTAIAKALGVSTRMVRSYLNPGVAEAYRERAMARYHAQR